MKINSGQAPSTLIPEYIGSDFDKVIEVADNIEYVKDVAAGIEGLPVHGYIGETPPLQPLNGAEWYCTTDGRTYVWYKDDDSGQWVESSPQSTIETDPSIAHTVDTNTDNIFALWKRSAAEAGLNLVTGSFEEGGILTSSTDVLLHKESKGIYAWSGLFPHTVVAGTNPTAVTGYVPRTDVVLRGQLESAVGAGLVGTSRGSTVEAELTKSLSVLRVDGDVDAQKVADSAGRNVADNYATLEPTRGALDAIDNAGAVIIIGDSITNGANASPYTAGFSYRFTRSIMNRLAGVGSSDMGYGFETIMNMASAMKAPGLSHNGTLVAGGAADSRLRLNNGQAVYLTGREIDVFDVFYDASVSSGSLVFYVNGVVIGTKSISGTGTQSTFPTTFFTAGSIHPDDTVAIMSSGGTVYVTGLITLRNSQKSPYVTVVGKAAWGFDEFADSARADEVAAQVNKFRSSTAKTLFIFLGTNNIYNPSIQKTPEDYITALSDLIAAYKSRMTKINVVLSVPLQANETTFPLLAGVTYSDYVDAIVQYADANKYQVVRFDQTGIDTTFYSDGVHPSNAGHSAMAAKICETIGIPYDIGDFCTSQSSEPYRSAGISPNADWRQFGVLPATRLIAHKIGRTLHLSGIAEPIGAAGLAIGTVPAGFRPDYDVYTVANSNGTPVALKIASTGVITVASYVNWVSFQGVSFVLRPVQ